MKIKLGGEFQERARRNFVRLHNPLTYGLDHAFKPVDYDWPGDWEGRLMLALTLLSDLLDQPSELLDGMVKALPSHLNDAGYLGPVYADGTINEQQLSGHGWLLRALSEYYRRHPDPQIKRTAVRILDRLVLPLTGKYRTYPVGLEARRQDGGAAGTLADRKCGDWLLSTDIGCAFILTDGVVQAAAVFDRPECRPLIEEMLTRLAELDLVGIKAQTHASLTAARGALRYYRQTGYRPGLELAGKIYARYRRYGMSEHFANYNWFGRPEWTEPCAIIDSYLLAFGLWQTTGETHYLTDAHCLWHTGVERAQRPNGGFGGDSCPRSEDPLLTVKFYEAWWCCTMRGGEGLFRRTIQSVIRDSTTMTIIFPGNYEAEFDDGSKIEVVSAYPEQADCRLTLLSGPVPETVRLFLPPGVKTASATVNGAPLPGEIIAGFLVLHHHPFEVGDRIDVVMPLDVEKRPSLHPESQQFGWWHGPVMLGWEPGRTPVEPLTAIGNGHYADANGLQLVPLNRFLFQAGLPETNDAFAADAAAGAATAFQVLCW